MLDRSELLTTREMALFVARGFLRFDGLVPAGLNARFVEEYGARGVPVVAAGTPLREALPKETAVHDVLALPRVQGIVQSLVGANPILDHHFVHVRKGAGDGKPEPSQRLHQDSTIDPRTHFDIQLLYFPEAVDERMGGTRFLPGSHMRLVNEASITRYQNFIGQKHVVCEAGSLFVFHHGIWHGGGCNRSQHRRIMYKLRLNPSVRQSRLWNTDDIGDEMAAPQPIFVPDRPRDRSDVQTILCTPERWFEADTGRLEFLNRIKLWRFVLGDESFDAHYWWTRLENTPS